MRINSVNKVLTDAGEIQLCTACKGDGKVGDHSWGSGPRDMCICSLCNGSGRTKTITAECKLTVPFDYSG